MAARKLPILVTGSSDGLGLLAARELVAAGWPVVLHARNAVRARQAMERVPGASGVLVGDLSQAEEVLQLGREAQALAPFRAVIHNAGVYDAPGEEILRVNVLAPYVLTCMIWPVERLEYLSSGLHRQGRGRPEDMRTGRIGYGESKLYMVLLAKAVARQWRGVLANAVDPGWVSTKMGGPAASDDLTLGYQTQVWLANSEEPRARVSGRYFYHGREVPCHPLADDMDLQNRFLDICGELTGVPFPVARP